MQIYKCKKNKGTKFNGLKFQVIISLLWVFWILGDISREIDGIIEKNDSILPNT